MSVIPVEAPVANALEQLVADGLACEHFELINESGNHAVPAGSESHFKLVIVSESFAGERLLARHRRVNSLVAELLAGPIHALALHTYTPDEWNTRFDGAPMSPPCMGGSKSPGGRKSPVSDQSI